MATRHTRNIQTGRAQLYVGVTTLDKPGQGSIEITGGSAGSISQVTINSVTLLLAAPVTWETSHAFTAQKLADAINNNITSPNYHARAVGAKCYVWQQTVVAGTITLASTVTGDVTKTDTNISGGAVGNGTAVGYTQEGCDITINDEFLDETTDESGVRVVKTFYTGENVQLTSILKQWDADALALRFPGRHSTTGDANRVEIPGTLAPGDDMDPHAEVMALVPDNKLYPTVLIRKGIVKGQGNVPIRFRTQETKRLAILINCMPDENHSATNYKSVGIDLAQNLTL